MTLSRAKIHRMAVPCALLLAACAATRAPIVEIDDASAALGRARAQDAGRLAPEELRLAEDKLVAARAAAAERDVRRARALGEQAAVDADLAAARARHAAARFAVQARADANRKLRRELLGEDRR
jgi:hypothetical protein